MRAIVLVICHYGVLAELCDASTAVAFSRAEASYHVGDEQALQRTIDGLNVSPSGWNVGDSTDVPQEILFITESPLEADLLELSLCFMSGTPNSAFANFRLTYTTDEEPSMEGKWESLPILNYSALTTQLHYGRNKLFKAREAQPVVQGRLSDEIYRISTRLPGLSVTGFRIEVFPVKRLKYKGKSPVMSWAVSGEFALTEFRVEVVSTSTNVALGAKVTTNYPIYHSMSNQSLTDGWPSTIAHPAKNVPVKQFYFDIDLGLARSIDHIGLRQRGDPTSLERFGMMRIKLYEQDPNEGGEPVWETYHRADGSYPAAGEVDIVRHEDGHGSFQGRYIRISSEQDFFGAPQLAEVEVYETRTPRLVSWYTDDVLQSPQSPLEISPDIQSIGFHFDIPESGRPYDLLYRWRIVGDGVWKNSNKPLLEIACPAAGEHLLEVQAAHSDGTWDESVLHLPFVVDVKFTETWAFIALVATGTLVVGGLITRYIDQRRILQLKAASAVEEERSRIAANMHDDVGARLAQLAILHDVFALEHELPEAAKEDLKSLNHSARAAMASLDEAVWSVNPRNANVEALTLFLMQYLESYLMPLGVQCHTQQPEEYPLVELRAGIRHEVVLAFKEALQNIAKHAGATEVTLDLKIDSGYYVIKVTDNGQGFSMHKNVSGGDGLLNMRRRLESIRGNCRWIQNSNSGTTVEMKFPLT